jgi:hypothetical protein
VPELNKAELEMLAGVGALAKLQTAHRHPLFHQRAELNELGVTPAKDLCKVPNGGLVRVWPDA